MGDFKLDKLKAEYHIEITAIVLKLSQSAKAMFLIKICSFVIALLHSSP